MHKKRMLAGLLSLGCLLSTISPAMASAPVEDRPVSPAELAELEATFRRQEAELAEQAKWTQIGPDTWEWVDPSRVNEPAPPPEEGPCYLVAPPPDAETGMQSPMEMVQVPCDGSFTSSAELVETPAEENARDAVLSVNAARDFSLAYAAENLNVYAGDMKTKLFTLAKGDALLVKDQDNKTLSPWTAVLVMEKGRDVLAYVRSSKLARKDKNTLKVRDLGKYSQYCAPLDAHKSYKIYEKACPNSKQIGTLRKAMVLPVISVGNAFTAVRLYDGVGYVANDCVALMNDGV